ncbi:hypothetical protein [Coxiella burnetii]|uniref:Hypothetical cytosolic protein n=1 Tax=Coxiella burnetii (strain RSA 493 / Nine Mile phase I) TaxID=227377 RepID=Q83CB3_COXBU|nr:hypothetical protein [Coxiella burnetii]NP_820209.1 hypothetical protein CBU_1214 [Coxiella burnetii RSA 493]AAO90723.1 hypothetical cytosolic protein [Coxiella burnetii RSA 493]ARI66007.1 hypothetical protein B7L74_06230 [Coxiella burnetii]ATN66583.1 hypothetical protein AYM17_03815 [Coxiella burnetii]MCF2094185.1 hypothetical protein [Coxiella burnetii]MCF2096222.1 hypothetical protein [Coxiella burnetii]
MERIFGKKTKYYLEKLRKVIRQLSERLIPKYIRAGFFWNLVKAPH